MKKLSLIMFLIISFTSVTENIYFSVILSGNNFGDYSQMSKIQDLIADIEKRREDVIKINVGNNYDINLPEADAIYNKAYSKFDFNLLGKPEYSALQKGEDGLQFSAINFFDKRIIPYKILNYSKFNVLIMGITNSLSDNNPNLMDYYSEIQKIIYKFSDNVDIIILVSELEREDNIVVLREFKNISFIVESGYRTINKNYLELEKRFIFSTSGVINLDLTYNAKANLAISKRDDKFSEKAVFLEGMEKFSNFSEYKEDFEIFELSKIADRIKTVRDEEIIGFNRDFFKKKMFDIGEKIEFLDNLSYTMLVDFEVDAVAFTEEMFLDDIGVELLSRRKIREKISNDYLIVSEISKDDYEVLKDKAGVYVVDVKPKDEKLKVLTTEKVFDTQFSEMFSKNYSYEDLSFVEFFVGEVEKY